MYQIWKILTIDIHEKSKDLNIQDNQEFQTTVAQQKFFEEKVLSTCLEG